MAARRQFLQGRVRLEVLHDLPPGDAPPHEAFRSGITTETIGSVQRVAGNLSCRPNPAHGRGAVDVRLDPAHGVMGDRSHGNRREDRIQGQELHADFPDQRKGMIDLFRPQVRQIQVDVIQTAGAGKTPAFQDLGHFGPRDDIPRRQFHEFRGILFHETLAFGISQISAFAPASLRHQDARRDKTRGVKLQKLGIFQMKTGPVCDRLAIAADGLGVGRKGVQRSQPAGGDEHRLGPQHHEFPRGHEDPRQPAELTVLYQDGRREKFIVPGKILILHQGVIKGLDLEETGFIRRHRGPGKGVSAEGTLLDTAVGASRPGHSPVIQLQDLFRAGFHEAIHYILIREKIGAFDRVPGMQLQVVAVFFAHDGRRAAFRTYGMGTLNLDFRNEPDVDGVFGFACDLDRRTQSRKPRSKNQHIVCDHFHFSATIP